MTTVKFNCYQVSSGLPLKKIADFFKIRKSSSWEHYIILNDTQLDIIFDYKTDSKSVYIFEFGCITFVNFAETEIYTLLKYIEWLAGSIDYSMLINYNEYHTITIDDNNKCRLWEDAENSFIYDETIISLVSIALAKSTALLRIDNDISNILHQTKDIINLLHRGSLKVNTRRFTKVTAKILRFSYELINSVRIFDTPYYCSRSIEYKNIYNLLSEYYELHDRFEILQNKMDSLNSIIKQYSSLSYNSYENRLYNFEAFLLALFPLSYIIPYILNHDDIMQWLKGLIKKIEVLFSIF